MLGYLESVAADLAGYALLNGAICANPAYEWVIDNSRTKNVYNITYNRVHFIIIQYIYASIIIALQYNMVQLGISLDFL